MIAAEQAAESRSIPWSCEAEQSVLGALLQDSSAIDLVPGLKASDFHDAAHRTIFGVLQREAAAKRPADVVSVYAALQTIGADDSTGGLAYLQALELSVPGSRAIKRHAELVTDRAKQRALIAAAAQAAEIAWGPAAIAEKLEAIGALLAGLQSAHVAKVPRSIVDIALERTQHYDDLQEGRAVAGWSTRIPSLDSMLSGGLRPGGLYIVAARPKVGKSSFAQTLAMVQASAGRPSLFLSQEMSEGEVADRAVANVGRIDYSALLSGRMDADDWSRASDALETLRDATLFVDDQGGLTLRDIKAKARSVRGLQVLIVDYLQLCSSHLTDSNRNGQIEEISRGLKALAKEAGMAVIALSQLNRQVEQRASKRPQLSDLRDSGAIEQDADAVIFLWPVRDHGASKTVGCAVEANRQGRCGAFALDFHGPTQRWGESTEPLESSVPPRGTRKQFE